MGFNLNKGTKGRAVPRIVCCAIPISRTGQVLVVTSRKRPNNWVCEYFLSSSSQQFPHSILSQYQKVDGN